MEQDRDPAQEEDLIDQADFEQVYQAGGSALPPAGRARPLGPGEVRVAGPRQLAPMSLDPDAPPPESVEAPPSGGDARTDPPHPGPSPATGVGAPEPADGIGPSAELGRPDPLRPLNDLATARVAIDAAGDLDQLGRVLTRLALAKARRVVVLRRRRGAWLGWTGAGEGVEPERVAALVIPPVDGTIFSLIASTGGHYLGPLADHPVHRRFLHTLHLEPPASLGLFPIHFDKRASLALYLDGGAGGRLSSDIGNVLAIAQHVPRALARLAREAAAAS